MDNVYLMTFKKIRFKEVTVQKVREWLSENLYVFSLISGIMVFLSNIIPWATNSSGFIFMVQNYPLSYYLYNQSYILVVIWGSIICIVLNMIAGLVMIFYASGKEQGYNLKYEVWVISAITLVLTSIIAWSSIMQGFFSIFLPSKSFWTSYMIGPGMVLLILGLIIFIIGQALEHRDLFINRRKK